MENKFSVEQFIEFLELFVHENTNPLSVKFFHDLIDIEGLIRENIDGEINESKVLGLEIPIFNDSQLNINLVFNLISSLGVIPTFKVDFDGFVIFHICERESLFFSDKGDNPTHKLLLKLLKELKQWYGY
jgi:hypothetical protein